MQTFHGRVQKFEDLYWYSLKMVSRGSDSSLSRVSKSIRGSKDLQSPLAAAHARSIERVTRVFIYARPPWKGKQIVHKSQDWIRIDQKVKDHVGTLSVWKSIGKRSRVWVKGNPSKWGWPEKKSKSEIKGPNSYFLIFNKTFYTL